MTTDARQQSSLGPSIEAPDGARAQLAATVAALREPAAYGSGEPGPVETVETHMSFVLLTRRWAYKLKKPLRTALLDYCSADARRRACEIELSLNRRLAPDVYLGVVPVVRAPGGLRVDVPGPAIDWMVWMRRLPRERMLDVCIGGGRVEVADVDRLAAVLTRFYASGAAAATDGPSYRTRIEADLAAKRVSLAQPHYGLDRQRLGSVAAAQRRWLERHAAALEARSARVVDAHGDLRPEHVCLEDPPVVIDCLEFDRSLRLLDPVSELAFLALECRRLGGAWIGARLLARYAEQSGDRFDEALVPFYQSHHALIRAAIAVWHLDDHALDHSERWRERGSWYLETAHELLDG